MSPEGEDANEGARAGAPILPGEHAAHRELHSWLDVSQALDELIAMARRTLDVFDHSLALQNWGTKARCEALHAAMRDRKLHVRMLLVDTRHVSAELPRLINLLKTHGQQLEILGTSARSIPAANYAVADRQQLLFRPNSVHSRGSLTYNSSYKSISYAESFEVLWQQGGERVFPEAFGL